MAFDPKKYSVAKKAYKPGEPFRVARTPAPRRYGEDQKYEYFEPNRDYMGSEVQNLNAFKRWFEKNYPNAEVENIHFGERIIVWFR